MSERIFEAIRITERTFTTQPKHRHGCVRKTALSFVGLLRKQGYQRIPLSEAQELFSHAVDRWDRSTIKAYFGAREGFSEHIIDRTATYATGTVSIKKIQLKQKIREFPGYFQRMGLCSYVKHGQIWFMVLNEVSIVPELARMSTPTGEASLQASSPCANFSLTPTDSEDTPTPTLTPYPLPPTIGRERKSLDFSTPTQQFSPRETAVTVPPKPFLRPAEQAAVEERDRKRLETLDKDLLQHIENSVKDTGVSEHG